MLLLWTPLLSYGQDSTVFELESRQETILLTTGGVFALSGYLGRNSISGYTEEQLIMLPPPTLWAIDEPSIRKWSTEAQDISDIFLYTSLATPALLLAHRDCRSEWKQGVVMYFETMLFTYGVTDIIKSTVQRDRPLVYNIDAPLSEKTSTKARLSFISGHTSMSTASCVFTARTLTAITKDDRWDPVIWAAGFTIPAVVAYLRVEGGKHYPTDVIGGYALGAVAGYLIPQLHRTRNNSDLSLGLGSAVSPVGFHITWSPRSTSSLY